MGLSHPTSLPPWGFCQPGCSPDRCSSSLRFTCPFVEKFSIDIETFYKTDAGDSPDVFSLSPVEKSQLTTGERAASSAHPIS